MMETNRPSNNINNADAESGIFAPFALANADVIYYNSNSQQPTANSQQPTANSQQPTANSQQPTIL
ncbi:MAG: hypothetical protein LBO82_09625 [Synergistaceae bacterium]|nr:hypothetical protein [Synergistaceae bacterium]